MFTIKQGDEYSSLREIKAGVPQGSILGHILYLIYTRDIPVIRGVHTATYADDTAILSVGKSQQESIAKLQSACDEITNWAEKWKIKLNEQKSLNINFTYKNIKEQIPINLNRVQVPFANTAKYLGMKLDTKIKWKEHVKKKRIELDMKYKEMKWIIGRKSNLPVHLKVLIYNQILKPVWLYGIQLWGCTKSTNINVIQDFTTRFFAILLMHHGM